MILPRPPSDGVQNSLTAKADVFNDFPGSMLDTMFHQGSCMLLVSVGENNSSLDNNIGRAKLCSALVWEWSVPEIIYLV